MKVDRTLGFRGKFVPVKSAKKRKSSSRQWLLRQLNDPYVAKAQINGYRSRAAYKLLEINDKFKLLKPGMKIVDLGAAPGGWSQVAAKIVIPNKLNTNNSLIIAVDLLEIEPIAGVQCLQQDFYAHDTESMIMELLNDAPNFIEVLAREDNAHVATRPLFNHGQSQRSNNRHKADIVMSDMAANTIGHAATDHIRTLNLCEHALEFALKVLKPQGHFIAKIFRGGLENTLLTKIKLNFQIVKHFKPAASRKESTEEYLIALNKK
ncbi:RlmE family RNA methyltransferase [Candidatus Tisiphia endosymbiont of Nemotelus uliginosus]|uniref:RlmE family RNA methyltransferase n=1 Tax=Candidatus Tisiphia endosymbiont of Nemotelus uliginosus TaxID=3077926 RepID=UPI0035C8E68F